VATSRARRCSTARCLYNVFQGTTAQSQCNRRAKTLPGDRSYGAISGGRIRGFDGRYHRGLWTAECEQAAADQGANAAPKRLSSAIAALTIPLPFPSKFAAPHSIRIRSTLRWGVSPEASERNLPTRLSRSACSGSVSAISRGAMASSDRPSTRGRPICGPHHFNKGLPKSAPRPPATRMPVVYQVIMKAADVSGQENA
jgi:hypothetical protein